MKKLIPIVAVSLLSVTLTSTAYAADVQDKQKELTEKQQEVKETQKELSQEKKKESVENAKIANESMQQISRASKIIGTKVKDTKGDKLGDIKDLVLDPESGQVVYAVVTFGGVLGVGNKLFAVPWKALHWTRDKEYYVLDLDKETLKKAPGFDKKHWPDSSNKWEQQREELNQFYQVKP
jgi:sporulation protein YlmC with PRC-barrel domain